MTSFVVLLNGSLGESFKSSRGLHQGDLLSPMIFILAIEVLTQMFLKAQGLELASGFIVSSIGMGFRILQFMDDTLILFNGSCFKATVVSNIFIWFKACSSLKVNTTKLVLYQVNKVYD